MWARRLSKDGKQQYHPLGDNLDYDDAKEKAEDWLSQLAGSPIRKPKRGTVVAALEAYLAHLRRHGREDAAKSAEGRIKTAPSYNAKTETYDDALATLRLEVGSVEIPNCDCSNWLGTVGMSPLGFRSPSSFCERRERLHESGPALHDESLCPPV